MKREQIADKDKWVLEDLVADESQWEALVAEVLEKIKKVQGYNGRLAESADALYDYLNLMSDTEQILDRLTVYANERMHEDTRVAKNQALADLASRLCVEYSQAAAFSVPEILAIAPDTLEKFYQDNTGLQMYCRYLSELSRQREHTLSDEMETLLAGAGEVALASSDIFSMFNDADITFGTVLDEKGEETPLTHGNYISFLKSRDRSFRERVFKQYYQSYIGMKNTLGAMFAANMKQDNFFAKARRYDSALAMHLDRNNIPETVFTNLIDAVHRRLPVMYRYMEVRKERLGVDKLHMYDIAVPIVREQSRKITYEDAKAAVAEALAPMGKEYISILKEGFDGGWIDVYENEGKRSGAYSWSAYGTHPYVLLNHQDTIDGMFTLAHEMGHAIHSYYSMKEQPFVYSNYCIFVAEVASTCNEALLTEYLLAHSKDTNEKLYIINQQLEAFRTTVYRQTMFAEFEWIIHKKAQTGEAVTAEVLSEVYYDLNKLYYGEAVASDEEIAMEWARIPHFYTPYYVYQYATGYAAAVAFSQKILKEGEEAVTPYVNHFLKGGNKKDPIDLLAAAGVDMKKPEAVEQALDKFEEQLALFEKLSRENA